MIQEGDLEPQDLRKSNETINDNDKCVHKYNSLFVSLRFIKVSMTITSKNYSTVWWDLQCLCFNKKLQL